MSIFVQVFWLDTLIINIIKHDAVPKPGINTRKERLILNMIFKITINFQLF